VSRPTLRALVLLAAGLAGACDATSPGVSGSPGANACAIDAMFIDGGPGIQITGSGFEPDEPATLTLGDGDSSETFTQTTNPALRTDIRGVVLFAIGAERENVGLNRFELTSGGCTATTSLEVVTTMFPPACPAGAPVASGGTTVDAYAALVVADAPIGYWRFEEDAGPLASATVGAAGAIQGDGVFGQPGAIQGSRALGLDGDGDMVDIVDIELPADFTIEGWISFCENDITNEDALVGPVPNLNFHDAKPRLWSGEMDVVFAETSVEHDRWYHVAVTRAGPDVTLYVDGVAVHSDPFADSISIGALGYGDAGWTSGQLDEIAIYDHALTPDQLAAHVAAAS
jgi:hypothetical protein